MSRSADLITSAQLTPVQKRLNHRRALAKSRSHKLHDVRVIHRIVTANRGNGLKQHSFTQSSWDISSDCLSPVTVTLDGAPCDLAGKRVRGVGHCLTMFARCRKCATCLKRRSNLWAWRAKQEIASSSRTWFATFTASPGWQSLLEMRASHRLTQGGTDLQSLSANDKFAELCREFGAELTKYFKRLRKNTGAKFRYILVAEAHKSGKPHFHALIHEEVEGGLKHAQLTSTWKLGFTKFKVVSDVRTAWYVTKYLSKSALARVRASLTYGQEKTPSGPRVGLWPISCNLATPKQSLGGHPSDQGFNHAPVQHSTEYRPASAEFNAFYALAKALGATYSSRSLVASSDPDWPPSGALCT